MRNQCAIRMYTSETLEDGIKSGSRPAEKNNSKKHTFEYVKINFFGRTKGGALLKCKKKKKRKRDERGRKTKIKKTDSIVKNTVLQNRSGPARTTIIIYLEYIKFNYYYYYYYYYYCVV